MDNEKIVASLRMCAGGKCNSELCPWFQEMDCEGELMRDAANRIEALNAAQPGWISVKERLPEAKVAVLGYGLRHRAYPDTDPFPATHVVYTRGEDEGWFTFWNQEYVAVTHWMPLPEPPKEVET